MQCGFLLIAQDQCCITGYSNNVGQSQSQSSHTLLQQDEVRSYMYCNKCYSTINCSVGKCMKANSIATDQASLVMTSKQSQVILTDDR